MVAKWTSRADFVPAIRYAEVLLNLAEALTRINGLDARAITLLKAVRKRSDPATNLVGRINMLLRERRIEFWVRVSAREICYV